MATKSGSFVGDANRGFYIKADWSFTQDVDKNTTTITLKLYYYQPWANEVWNKYPNSAYYIIQGTKTFATFDSSGVGYHQLGSKTWTIAHNADGSCADVTVSCQWCTGITTSSTVPTNVYLSGRLAIPSIPRRSTVSAIDANIESSTIITISAASKSFTHTLKYTFGTLTGNITMPSATATSVSFQIPTTFYAKMPNATSAKCTIECETFNSGKSLGTSTCQFTVRTDSAKCKPTVSGTVVDSNSTTIALTGNSAVLVRFCSTASATLTASAKNSATISTRTINGISGASKSFANCEDTSFVFKAVDSRGYSASVTLKPTVVEYIKLTNNCSLTRVGETGDTVNIAISGKYFAGSFGAESNSITVKWRIRPTGGSWSAYTTVDSVNINGNTFSASASATGCDYQTAYDVQVVAQDKVMSASKTVSVSKSVPIIDWGESDVNVNGALNCSGIVTTTRINSGYSLHKNTAALIPLPYIAYSDLGTSGVSDFLKELLKWICAKYPDVQYGTWIGSVRSGGVGIVVLNIYNTSEVQNGYPRYASGIYTLFNATTVFDMVDYAWATKTL